MEAGEGWDVTFNFVVEGVLLLLVAALGLAGNLASFVILMRQKVQKIFHNLLFLLSTFDTVSRRLPYKIYLFIYRERKKILPFLIGPNAIFRFYFKHSFVWQKLYIECIYLLFISNQIQYVQSNTVIQLIQLTSNDL